MLLIKPALPYLDVLSKARERTNLPLGAYHVSGEYAMLMAAAQLGWIDGDRVLEECLLSIKRARADFIFTYGAKRMATLLVRFLKSYGDGGSPSRLDLVVDTFKAGTALLPYAITF